MEPSEYQFTGFGWLPEGASSTCPTNTLHGDEQIILPPSLGDLRIKNVPSGAEFILHLPLLASQGIGTCTRVCSPQELESAAIVECGLRLTTFISLLEKSEFPIHVFQTIINRLYNSTHPVPKAAIDASNSIPFNLSKCVEMVQFILEAESAGIILTPLVQHWQDRYLKRATSSEVIALLHRLFYVSSIDALQTCFGNPNPSSYKASLLHILALVLEVVRKFLPQLLEDVASLELSECSVGTAKVMLLSRLVYGRELLPHPSKSPIDLIQARYSRFYDLAWRWAAADTVETLACALSDSLTIGSGDTTLQGNGEKVEDVDMVEAGQKLRIQHDCHPSEFAIGIEGNGAGFIIVQSTTLIHSWEYFKRICRANLSEMKNRVIVLPSYFPSALLPTVLALCHHQVADMAGLNRKSLDFVLSHGVEFGLLANDPEQMPYPLFAKLHRRATATWNGNATSS